MSVVIAVKDKDRFILGADKQCTSGWQKKSHNVTKVWEVKQYPGCCMGAVGSARGSQVIANVSDLLSGLSWGTNEIAEEYVTLALPRIIYETLKNNGIDCAENGENDKYMMLPCAFFFAYKDRCWCINTDMFVEEVESYMAIGSGEEGAIHSMDTARYFYDEQNPFKLISQAIHVVAENTLYVDHEIDFVSTFEYKEQDLIDRIAAEDPEAAEELVNQLKEAKKKAKAEAKAAKEKEKLAKEKAKAKELAKKEKAEAKKEAEQKNEEQAELIKEKQPKKKKVKLTEEVEQKEV